MRSLRALRTGVVTGVIAWKLTALALLPAALCCRAAMDPVAPLTCCEGQDHGAMCPMAKSPNRAADPSDHSEGDQPTMVGCNSLDDALIGLVSQAGFTPDAFTLPVVPADLGRVAPTRVAATSFASVPHAPPPRA